RTAKTAQGFHWLEDCLANIFTLQPVRPAIKSIAPGTGFAFGPSFNIERRLNRTELLSSATLLRSTDGSNLGMATLTIAMPAWSLVALNDNDRATAEQGETAEESGAGYHDSRTRLRPAHDHAAPHLALVRDYWKVDSKLSLSFSVDGM